MAAVEAEGRNRRSGVEQAVGVMAGTAATAQATTTAAKDWGPTFVGEETERAAAAVTATLTAAVVAGAASTSR